MQCDTGWQVADIIAAAEQQSLLAPGEKGADELQAA